ncbi:MAG: 50S ribosomal protein L24 [Thermoguttaceae bacterium]|nr:50S ribosomal protein L24 [Thermoguttaceae bacterium]
MRIKKDDTVQVLSGKDRGTQGKVIKVDRENQMVSVAGAAEVFRHVRRSQKNVQGGRLSKNMPIPVGKVMLVCPTCSKPTRVGARVDENGKKVRFCKKCNAVIE